MFWGIRDKKICRQGILENVLSAPVQGEAGEGGVDNRVEYVTPDGLSGRKRVWFRGIFHLIGILGESRLVSKLRKAGNGQDSGQPLSCKAIKSGGLRWKRGGTSLLRAADVIGVH